MDFMLLCLLLWLLPLLSECSPLFLLGTYLLFKSDINSFITNNQILQFGTLKSVSLKYQEYHYWLIYIQMVTVV